jgi:CHAD domain-containing protein
VDESDALAAQGEPAATIADELAPVRARSLALVDAAAAARSRLAAVHQSGEEDAEAIHDFRVALRRLRSALRPLGLAWGKKKTKALAERIRAVADLTGELRDEEVLRETLGDLEIAAETRTDLGRWQLGRARRERGTRTRVANAILGSEDLDGVLADIRARIGGPAKHELSPHRLANEAIARAVAKVKDRAHQSDSHDKLLMHKLRIAAKQLRYTAELFEGLTDVDTAKIIKAGAKLQKRLGTLHDLDEAQLRMGRAYGLAKPSREVVIRAVETERERVRKKCADEIPHELKAIEKAAET